MKKSFLLGQILSSKQQQKQPKQRPKTSSQARKSGLTLKSSDKPTGKKSVTKQIDALMARITDTNQNIKQTEKMLDIDLFLKTQKQKRLQYARQLNSNYELEKKKRQEKLYKKFNRQQREQITDVKGRLNDKSGLKKKTAIPLDIMKIFNFNSSKITQEGSIQTILNGHHYNFGFGNELEKIIQEKKLCQESITKHENIIKFSFQKDKTYDDREVVSKFKKVVQIAKNSVDLNILNPIKISQCQLIPYSESQNLMNALTFLLIHPQFSQAHYLQSPTTNNSSKLLLCKFYDYGIRRSILTCPTIQVRQFSHKDVIIGSRMQNQDIFWPGIIEKCYRLMKYPYGITKFSKITLHQTIYDIYGLDAEVIALNSKSLIIQNFPKVLYSLLMDDCMIGFVNSSIQNNIYTDRMYPLISVENRTVKKQKTEFQYRVYDPWYGKLLSSDNKKIFNILELCQLFDRIVIVRSYPAKWKQLRIKASFFSNGAINSLNNQWTKNTQYLFTVTKNSLKARIVLRKIRDRQESVGKEKKPEEQSGFYGFLLFKNPQYLTHVTCMKIQNLITKVKSTDINGTSYFCDLQKGNYIIVPFTNNPSQKEYKFFYLDFFVERQDGINFGKAKTTDYYFTNTDSQDKDGNLKVIQEMKTEDKFEKPKIQIMNLPQTYKTQKNLIQNRQRKSKGMRPIQDPKITIKYLQSLNITLFKGVELQNFFIPGNISSLLINKQIPVQTEKVKKTKGTTKKNKQSYQNTQLTQCEKQQNLNTILGYDAMSQDINRGQMKQIMIDGDDQVDLADFELGSQGLTAIMEALLEKPRIQSINLQNNNLNDHAVTFLCYYLDKSNRVELRVLDLRRNPGIGKMGMNAVKGLGDRFENLQIKVDQQKRAKKK